MDKISKAEIKNIIIGSIKIISFILVLAILLDVLSLTYFSKKGAVNYDTDMNKAYEFLQEPKNTIDVVSIGNSDLYSAFVPAELWSRYGYTSTTIASPHQTPFQSYQILQTVFENQKPQVVIIETDMMYDEALDEVSVVKRDQTILEFIFENFNTEDLDDIIESHFSIFTFHDKWKHAGKQKKDETPNSHGYKFSDTVCKVKISDYMIETDKKEPITQNYIDSVKKMYELCKENGAEVFFVEMPTVTSWNMERHNAVAEVSENLGADFIDYNLIVDEVGINLNRSFRDSGNHLNYNAACKITDHVGNFIAEKYKLPDRRNDPKYKFYQVSIDKFYKEIEAEREKAKNNLLSKKK